LNGSTVYYYVIDGNKNVTALIDASGNVVAEYEYDQFGKILSKNGAMADINPLRFSSEYYDVETGLIYYNYRYYSPDLRRWLSRDPIGEVAANNKLNLLYGFVNNNPIKGMDLLGLITLSATNDVKEQSEVRLLAGINPWGLGPMGDVVIKRIFADASLDKNVSCISEISKVVPGGTSNFNNANISYLTYIGGGFIIEFKPNPKFPKSRLSQVGWTQDKMNVGEGATTFTDDTNTGWQGKLDHADFPGGLTAGGMDKKFKLHLNICTKKYDFEWHLTITRTSYKNPDNKDIEDINVTISIN